VKIFVVLHDPACVELNLAISHLRSKPSAYFRRYTVAMDFPVRSHVAKKSALLRARKCAPDFLRERTQTVDHSTPAAALSLRSFYLHTNQP
jgi:hypothetical protein